MFQHCWTPQLCNEHCLRKCEGRMENKTQFLLYLNTSCDLWPSLARVVEQCGWLSCVHLSWYSSLRSLFSPPHTSTDLQRPLSHSAQTLGGHFIRNPCPFTQSSVPLQICRRGQDVIVKIWGRRDLKDGGALIRGAVGDSEAIQVLKRICIAVCISASPVVDGWVRLGVKRCKSCVDSKVWSGGVGGGGLRPLKSPEYHRHCSRRAESPRGQCDKSTRHFETAPGTWQKLVFIPAECTRVCRAHRGLRWKRRKLEQEAGNDGILYIERSWSKKTTTCKTFQNSLNNFRWKPRCCPVTSGHWVCNVSRGQSRGQTENQGDGENAFVCLWVFFHVWLTRESGSTVYQF